MMALWPETLPQRALAEGYSEGFRDGRLQTAPEAGPPKMRRRVSSVGKPVMVSLKVDVEQLTRLEDFWDIDTQGGVLPFWFPDQTRGGVQLFTESGVALETDIGAPFLNAAWWLVMFGGTPPSIGTRTRGMSYIVPVPLTVLR